MFKLILLLFCCQFGVLLCPDRNVVILGAALLLTALLFVLVRLEVHLYRVALALRSAHCFLTRVEGQDVAARQKTVAFLMGRTCTEEAWEKMRELLSEEDLARLRKYDAELAEQVKTLEAGTK